MTEVATCRPGHLTGRCDARKAAPFPRRVRAPGLQLVLAVVLLLLALAPRTTADSLESGFTSPPREARARVLWMWMNGNVTADGITRDLEAIQRVGLGGALIFNIGEFIPKGPVVYGSAEWQALMVHAARECDRLGLELAMHNCPGWSSSGGPWITPETAMQQFVWSEAFVSTAGDTVAIDLHQPLTHLDYYRDIRVLGFPSLPGEDRAFADRLVGAKAISTVPTDLTVLADRNLATSIEAGRESPLVIRFDEPFEARAATILPRGGGSSTSFEIAVSDDGTDFRPVATYTPPEPRSLGDVPLAVSFEPTRARYWRLTPAARSKQICEFTLHAAARIENWDTKAGYHLRVAREEDLPPGIPGEFAIDPASIVDLTDQFDPTTGRITWNAPAGSWTILRFGHTASGRENIAAPDTGVGLECDKLSPRGADAHFRGGLLPMIESLGPLAGSTFTALEVDSYEVGFQNWTAGFEQDFAARNGYDITPFLPAMTGRYVGDAVTSERFLWDLRRTHADMIADHYYGRLRELFQSFGIALYVEPYGAAPGPYDELQIAVRADMAMGEIWARFPWDDTASLKLAASATHTQGFVLVGAEAFTAMPEQSRWLEHPYALKSMGDLAFSLGVNRLLFHRYAMQPHPDAVPGMTMGPWGIHYDRTNTWFEQSAPWIEYLARSQHILQQGRFVADVLHFTGEGAPQRSRRTVPTLPAGYAFDAIDTETLLRRTSVHEGRIVLPDGASYRLLTLPADLKSITPVVARHVRELAASGATIVLGDRPGFSPSLREQPAANDETRRLVDELWGGRLPGVFTGQTLAEVLPGLGLAPDFEFTAPRADTDIVWLHRQTDEAEIYFVANRRRRAEEIVATFRVTGRQPELWQAETGTRRDAPAFTFEDGRTQVPLALEPSGAVFVIFRKSAVAAMSPTPPPPQPDTREKVRPPEVTNTFTITAWINPETSLLYPPRESTDRKEGDLGKSFIVPARDGDTFFGPGHAIAGIAAGRNGVCIIERDSQRSPAVLMAPLALSGWTHLAVVYREGVPSLYVNGAHVRDGLSTGRTIHPGLGLPPPDNGRFLLHFEGDMTEPELFAEALDAGRIAALAREPLPAPLVPPGMISHTELDGPWQVGFPSGRSAPPSITLPALAPLQLHDDPGVRHFAGTATYTKSFELPPAAIAAGRNVLLDLGRVSVIAEVFVNGTSAGILWKEPYRTDITALARPGANALEIRVTTLWPNRLIGDELLPPENDYNSRTNAIERLPDWYVAGHPKPAGGRTTFTTWRHFTKDDPLTESGLRGPVRILSAPR